MKTPAYLVRTTFNIITDVRKPYSFPEKIWGGKYLSRMHSTQALAEQEILDWHKAQAEAEGWHVVKVVEVIDYEVLRSYGVR